MKPFCRSTIILAVLLSALPLVASEPAGRLQLSVKGVSFEFVRIPAGEFLMGSENGDGDERPVHRVNIDYGFEVGKTEVTIGQFKVFVATTGYETDAERHGWAWHCPNVELMGPDKNRNWQRIGFEQTDDHPITCISFNDAVAFCDWLCEQTGQHFRLPTEAEWEYACRAGTTGDYTGDLHEMAWFDQTGIGGTSPVAVRKANAWGLYDMHGNVWEWCEDIYHSNYNNAPIDGSANTNPDVPAEIASRRVLRGGAWCKPRECCRSAFRYAAHRAFRDCGTGFRIVRARPPGEPKRWPCQSQTKSKAEQGSSSESEYPARVKLAVDGLNFDFVRIEPGEFTMGTVLGDEEMPAHKVSIGYNYYMAATEVTLEQFELFVEQTSYVTDAEKQGWAFKRSGQSDWYPEILISWRLPGFVQTENEPATCISWYDAVVFCEWLSDKTGRDIRLPSEAEWEYACRAGTTGDYAGSIGKMGWHRYNSGVRPHPVAQKKPNAWGLYDMHGNVWEWVQDVWHMGCDGAPTDGSAWLQADSLTLTMRGGSFANPPWWLCSYIHMRNDPPCRLSYNHGFRLVMDVCRHRKTLQPNR